MEHIHTITKKLDFAHAKAIADHIFSNLAQPETIEKAKTYAVSLAIASTIAALFKLYKIYSAQVNVPVVGVEKWSLGAYMKARQRRLTDRWALQHEGYEKFTKKGLPFRLPQIRRNQVYIPAAIIEEIKNLPESDVSFAKWTNTFFLPEYVGTPASDYPLHLNLIRGELTQNLGRFFEAISNECDFAVKTEVGEKEEWAYVPAMHKMVTCVARMSARVFVGPIVCRDEIWIKESMMCTINAFQVSQRLKPWNPVLRNLFAWTTKEVRVINATRANALKALKPEIERRREQKAKAEKEGRKWEAPEDMLQWLQKKGSKDEKTAEQLADAQLTMTLAAIHTTGTALANAVLDLVAHPEFAAELREELQQVLSRNNGKWTQKAMNELTKMDAFVKESLRLGNANIETFNRIVTNPNGITISSGVHFPKGTQLSAATDPLYTDASLFSNPTEFNPHRFNSTTKPGDAFTSTTNVNFLSFGYGKHACPGRFFANVEIKNVLARLVARYEVAFGPGGTPGPRPQRTMQHTNKGVDWRALVWVKLRPEAERLF